MKVHPCNLKKTTALWSLRYENQNSKNFTLRLRMNLLRFSGASIYLFCLWRKPVRDNLMLSPFSDLKELMFRDRYKIKTKPYYLWSLLFQNMKLQKCKLKNHKKEVFNPSSSMSSFFTINDCYIINPASMDFLLDRIYIKRPHSSYITLF